MRIDAITVGHRYREDLGDISALAESMRTLGQLQPIIVDQDARLLAGRRRMEAARRLGWTEIGAIVYDRLCPERTRLHVESAENECHKPFTNEERIRLAADIERAERELARERRLAGLKTGNQAPVSQPVASRGKAVDKAASAVGMSGESLRQGKAVLAEIDRLESRGRHLDATYVRGTLNKQGIKPAVKAIRAANATPKEPPPSDDRSMAKRMVERLHCHLIGGMELLEAYPAAELLDRHMIHDFERLARWLDKWRKRVTLRVV